MEKEGGTNFWTRHDSFRWLSVNKRWRSCDRVWVLFSHPDWAQAPGSLTTQWRLMLRNKSEITEKLLCVKKILFSKNPERNLNLWTSYSSQQSTDLKHMESCHFYSISLWPELQGSEGLSGLTGRQWDSHQSHHINALIGQKQEVDKQYLSSGFLFKLHLFQAANLQRDAKQHSCLCSYHWGSFISKHSSELLTGTELLAGSRL